MVVARRAYRAEAHFDRSMGDDADIGVGDTLRHREVMRELAELKTLIQPQPDAGTISEHLTSALRQELGEAAKLKVELDAIHDAIAKTKTEIAALHRKAAQNEPARSHVANELDAIVRGTEGATEQILGSAEHIDEIAATLGGFIPDEHQGMVNDIQERVITIFEACNFQDLTGQRITKVVATLSFVEERIIRMMEIWGGLESFKDVEVPEEPPKDENEALLHGPSLDGEEGVVSQDDIDALFA
ncbi:MULTISPECIES: protein phosphatase CheZ [Pseudovibrio]|uniref:protein phosphatase CheZ n=1 Tax=Stappiaceae TaxID=2821832 RepID=UPI0023660636|nr:MULTISPECIES: protein phosphatase CheZ [Pseudovibrio]MDD7911371.1 protein phosphatase CheZ [Pseudovibrio exalbescens]MDX5592942.1 protein phosphatase CheZ [Pseudovibrio sp. SPO723]